MKLWVDDVRRPPQGEGWTWVTNTTDAKICLVTGLVTEASLDHDLGDDPYTGYDLVKWMASGVGKWPTVAIYTHSMNPVGRVNIQATIDRYFKPQGDQL